MTEDLPEFFGYMGCKGIEKGDEEFVFIFGDAAGGGDIIEKAHHCCNCSVAFERINIGANLLDCLMN